MVIYRHYKGNLYFVEGYAIPFSNKFYNKDKTITEIVAKALYEPTLDEVDVILIHDSDVGSTYYAYKGNDIEGVMVFYRGLDGRNWLRPRGDFHGEITIQNEHTNHKYVTPRFKKVSGGHLFDIIRELMFNQK